ncbi:MAG: ABC transporter permease [Chloroflexaceae bacterium]|nr:ABC transporter permease [Chloroflexaceae bacterium]NJO06582.1 ABC transporter permease [Chloroflexaceae bacterium]
MNYLRNNLDDVWVLLLEHLQMTGIALTISLLVAVPIGILISRYRWLSVPVMGTLGILYTVPSLAMIVLMIPIFGLNATSVIVALIIYAQVILVRNVLSGLRSINPAIIEAAYGMGMNAWQCWWQVQVPLALPIVLAGVRIAAVVAIGIAAIGAKFNAGGLGTLLFNGIALGREDQIIAGSLVLAIFALLVNSALRTLEWLVDPQTHIKREEQRQRRLSVSQPTR